MTRFEPGPSALTAGARRGVCAAVLLGLLGGCATTQPVTPVPRGQSVELVAFKSPPAGPLKIENLSLAPAAKAGAGGGAAAGALSGLSCGPWAVICVPAGALIGGLAGLGGGAVVGLKGELYAAESTQLRDRLDQIQQSHDILAELRQNLIRRTGRTWDLAREKPAYVLTLELKGLELTSTRDRQIGMVMQVRASLRLSDPAATTALADKVYRCAPEPAALAAWVDPGSDFADTMFSSCSQQLTAQIVADFVRD